MASILLFFFVLICSTANADEYLVKGSLNLAKEKSGLKISFAVQKACDIQVTIKQNGKIVRHLAAGLVGTYSSEPFQKGLKQSILWDGLDDFKKPVSLKDIEVELGAKLKAEFDKILGWDGNYLTTARGFCFGRDGSLIVVGGEQLLAHRNSTTITRYKASGEYMNQIFPPAGGLEEKDRQGMPTLKLSTGDNVPVIYHMEARSMLPAAIFDFRSNLVLSKDGKSIFFLSGLGSSLGGVTEPDIRGGRRLLKLNIDGSVPEDYLGPVVISEKANGFASIGEGSIALSADGKFMLVTGLRRMTQKGRWGKKSVSTQLIYKVSMSSAKPQKVVIFAGVLKKAGSDNNLFNNPEYVDVDAKGNVYVTDTGNERVQIFDASGKYIETISSPGLFNCKVHNATGHIYLLTANGTKIVKYKSLSEAKPAFEFSVKIKKWRKFKLSKTAIFEINKYGKNPKIAILAIGFNRYDLSTYEEQGNSFKETRNPIKNKLKSKRALGFNRNIAVTEKWIMAQGSDFGKFRAAQPSIFNTVTGLYEGDAKLDRSAGGKEYMSGKDGLIYQHNGGSPKKAGHVTKYNLTFKQSSFGSLKSIMGIWHGHGGQSGFFVDRYGKVFSIGMAAYRGRGSNDGMGLRVKEFDAMGKMLSPSRIYAQQNVYLAGIVVDSKGNIYIGARISKSENSIPDWFKGKLPKDSKHHFPSLNYKQYAHIVKFSPIGGRFIDDPKGEYLGVKNGSRRGKVSIKGGKTLGKSIMIPIRGGKDGVHCHCETSRFDIDFYDRLIVPDLHQYCVRILDSNGKEILRIGSYGNMDNAGPTSKKNKPQIAFNWILKTIIYKNKIYVTDLNNRRIMVIRIDCQEVTSKKF